MRVQALLEPGEGVEAGVHPVEAREGARHVGIDSRLLGLGRQGDQVGLELGESDKEKRAREKAEKDLAPLLARMHGALGERVTAVRMTEHLTDSTACLTGEAGALSPQKAPPARGRPPRAPAEARARAQPGPPGRGPPAPLADFDDARFRRWTALLHDQALLAEGVLPSDPAAFARGVAELMAGE